MRSSSSLRAATAIQLQRFSLKLTIKVEKCLRFNSIFSQIYCVCIITFFKLNRASLPSEISADSLRISELRMYICSCQSLMHFSKLYFQFLICSISLSSCCLLDSSKPVYFSMFILYSFSTHRSTAWGKNDIFLLFLTANLKQNWLVAKSLTISSQLSNCEITLQKVPKFLLLLREFRANRRVWKRLFGYIKYLPKCILKIPLFSKCSMKPVTISSILRLGNLQLQKKEEGFTLEETLDSFELLASDPFLLIVVRSVGKLIDMCDLLSMLIEGSIVFLPYQ